MFKYGLFCNVLPLPAELSLLGWQSNVELLGKQGPFPKAPEVILFLTLSKPRCLGFFPFINKITMDLHWCKSKIISFAWNHKTRSQNRNRTAKHKTWNHLIQTMPWLSTLGIVLPRKSSTQQDQHTPTSQPTAHLTEICWFIRQNGSFCPQRRSRIKHWPAWLSVCTFIFCWVPELRFSDVPQVPWLLKVLRFHIPRVLPQNLSLKK